MTPSKPGRRTGRGFSLLEVVVVLIIVATVAAIAMPRYTGPLLRYRADAAANRIATDLGYARHHAVVTAQANTVRFDATNNSYVVTGVNDLADGHGLYQIELDVDPYHCTIESVNFDDPSDDSENPRDVIFDGFGRPDTGGSVVVRAGEYERTVVLDPDTGRAEIR